MEPTKPSKWKEKAERVETIELPSGNVVSARRPSLLSLMRRGQIPSHLYQIAMKIGEGINPAELPPDSMKPLIEFLAIYVSAAVVSPRIVMKDAKENEVSIDDVSDEDLFAIFVKTQGAEPSQKDRDREVESEALESFRKDGLGDPDRSSGEKILDAAVGSPGDS